MSKLKSLIVEPIQQWESMYYIDLIVGWLLSLVHSTSIQRFSLIKMWWSLAQSINYSILIKKHERWWNLYININALMSIKFLFTNSIEHNLLHLF